MTNWSNKELDGTIFLCGMILAFLLMIALTYQKPDFAALPTSEKIIDIIKDMFIFMAGYLFKKVSDLLARNGGDNTENGTNNKK